MQGDNFTVPLCLTVVKNMWLVWSELWRPLKCARFPNSFVVVFTSFKGHLIFYDLLFKSTPAPLKAATNVKCEFPLPKCSFKTQFSQDSKVSHFNTIQSSMPVLHILADFPTHVAGYRNKKRVCEMEIIALYAVFFRPRPNIRAKMCLQPAMCTGDYTLCFRSKGFVSPTLVSAYHNNCHKNCTKQALKRAKVRYIAPCFSL